MQITFYTTDHCTLCEDALNLLLSLPQLRGHQLVTVDIAQDEHLLDEFGKSIPVLEVNGERLCAPLAAQRVTDFLEQVLESVSGKTK